MAVKNGSLEQAMALVIQNQVAFVAHKCHGRPGDTPHIENFIQCIRSRSTPAADAEQGHYSGVLCHAANISWRLGNKKLRLDGKTETFVGEPEANRLIKRNYRKPWIFPEQV